MEQTDMKAMRVTDMLGDGIVTWVEKQAGDYEKCMAYYRCAIMEVETKFNVLNTEFSLQYDRNPISSIKSRLKNPRSITEKLERRGLEVTLENMEQQNL